MKKHEALEFAQKNYPIGIKFKQLTSKAEVESGGVFTIYQMSSNWVVVHELTDDFVFDGHTWAEIVENKTAEPYEDCATLEALKDMNPMLTTEDDVDLFGGEDLFIVVKTLMEKWELDFIEPDMFTFKLTRDTDIHNQHKYFSNEKSAREWIKKHNKIDKVEVELYQPQFKAVVTNRLISFKDTSDNYTVMRLQPSDIEDISHALKELNNGN